MKKKKNDIGTFFTAPIVISLVIIALIVLMSIFAPIIGPYDPDQMDMLNALQGPSLAHLFGTDQVGRDIFTRLMYGARTTLLSALLVVVISIIIGIPLGVISGYYGGKIDSVIMRAEDVLLAFPALLLAFLFVASFGKGIANAIIALGIVYVPMLSRLTRSLTLMEKNKTYVESARSIGFSDTRIIFRHILPNCIPTIIAQLTLDIGYAILDLAAMSFLGLGVQPPTSDWGAMLEEGRQYIQSNPALVFAPGLARALLLKPDFIMADEAVSALDVSVQAQILNLLLDLRESLGLTMMFISHELTVVEHVCDEIVVMYLGTVVEKAPTKELFLNILHPYTQALISAKPKEHPAQETHRIMLEGEAKSAMDMGEGCKFAPRCRFCQKGLCDAKTPKLREIRPGHFVACHRVESEEK